MKIRQLRFVVVGLIFTVLAGACRSEFERARLSNDPQAILKKGYEYYDEEEYLKAQNLFELVINQFRGTAEAERLFFHYAYTHYHLRQYRLAAHYFRNFSATFAYSDLREEADYMSAYSSYKLSPIFRLDQSDTEEAIQGFQEFINAYPDSDRRELCNALIIEMRAKLERKAYDSGLLYFDMKQYQAAIQTFENMLQDFPDTHRAERVRFLILESAYLYATNSIFDRRKERYDLTLEKYNDFIRRFPDSESTPKAQAIYADTMEQLKLFAQ
ncbi:MAG: outer membrane protein assembly factor BamD [Saprospiraceae bacterium]|nr:outer membrane protein assembly factor BamD [Saprospiraceae bacterium]